MEHPAWTTASVMLLVTTWPGKYGHHIKLAELLVATDPQEPKEIAETLKILGDLDLVRIVGAVDIRGGLDISFVGLPSSKSVLREFTKAIEELSKPEKNRKKGRAEILADFDSKYKKLAQRQVAANPIPGDVGQFGRHRFFAPHPMAA